MNGTSPTDFGERRVRRLTVLSILLLCLLPGVVFGQGPAPDGPRVIELIEATERRIELAESLAGATPAAVVAGEISIARELQSRARGSYAAGQYFLAGRASTEARGHADRAVAMLRGLPDPERVALQLERVEDELQRARERLADCSEARAQNLVRVAADMKGRADGAFAQERYLASMQLVNGARDRLQKALRICKLAEGVQADAQRALQRTDEVISRTRESLGADVGARIRQALMNAEALQLEARAEYQRGRYEQALRLTQVARVRAKRLAR